MAAGYRFLSGAGIFYPDAGTIADPFFDLGATFVRKTRVDGGAAGEAIVVPVENLEDFGVVRIRGKRRIQRATDFLGNGSLNAHAFDEEVISFVLIDRIPGRKAVKVVVPDSVGNQFVPRGDSVISRVDEKLTGVHIVLFLRKYAVIKPEETAKTIHYPQRSSSIALLSDIRHYGRHGIRGFLQSRQRRRTSNLSARQTGQGIGRVRCRHQYRCGGNVRGARDSERDKVA